jgi:uncharacterized membrane protein
MKSNQLHKFAVLVLLIAPILFLGIIYKNLPAEVPLHFGIDGKPDRFGNKNELLISIGILTLVNAGVFLLLSNLHKIDPKKSAATSIATVRKIAFAMVGFISIISILIIQSASSAGKEMPELLLPVIGIFFAILGNLMYSVKPNYFVGIRTPWALEDEDNWRMTHRLAGKLWFAGGVLVSVTAIFFPAKAGFIVLVVVASIITIVPFVYSYRYFKKHKINEV